MPSLSKLSTRAPKGVDKEDTKAETLRLLQALDEQQNLLYANQDHNVLCIFQGMDASGKDGAIRNVIGALNPQGISLHSFKAPTPEELSHDFLWRVHACAPAKGMIGVWNRSHYEDVLVTRVHGLIDKPKARERYAAINHFEQLLQDHNHTVILKFYLHISEEEQQQRLQERIDIPRKQWKYNENDFAEAKRWPDYRKAYQDVFKHCNEPEWIIVPADQNWYKEHLVAKHLLEAISSLNLNYPKTRLPQGKTVADMKEGKG